MFGIILLVLLLAVIWGLLFLPWLKGYRTVIFGWVTAVFGAVIPLFTQIVDFLQGLDWRTYVLAGDKKNLTVLAILGGIGVAGVILRYATTGPVGAD